jgi:hypothetical protein
MMCVFALTGGRERHRRYHRVWKKNEQLIPKKNATLPPPVRFLESLQSVNTKTNRPIPSAVPKITHDIIQNATTVLINANEEKRKARV